MNFKRNLKILLVVSCADLIQNIMFIYHMNVGIQISFIFTTDSRASCLT